jgi:SAM-dependent methyltransferase
MDEKQQRFAERYRAGAAPWDTGITPPEIHAILAELPPGRAIDVGCGTGTTLRTLLDAGWQADGVDFVAQAIEAAEGKLAPYGAGQYALLCADVSRLDALALPHAPYDLAIDIGCGHSVPPARQMDYVSGLAARLKPGATLMLYVHFPQPDHDHGWTPGDVRRLFLPAFEIIREALSDDTTTGAPSAWYRLQRHAV